jgi:excisionase family DNA binding protein
MTLALGSTGTADERLYYNVSQAAALLGVSRSTIWRCIQAGQLPVSRLGHRTVRIKREDLLQLMSQEGSAGAPTENTLTADTAIVHSVGPAGDRAVQMDWADAGTAGHFVEFYEDDGFLLDAVADFLGVSLRAGGSGILVATEAHRAGIEARLQKNGFDMAAARAADRFLSLNATETLLRILVDGSPEPGRFTDVVGDLVLRAEQGGRPVRIFGEMVALLMEEGRHAAAVRLEELWNELQSSHTFLLLCAYPMAGFRAEALASVLGDICAQHGRVLPTESYTALADPRQRLQTVARLQQKASSLEAAVLQRQHVEARLRRLQDITGQLSQSLEADQVLASIARSAADLLQVPVGAVFLFDRGDPEQDFVLAAAYGIDEAQAPQLRLPRRASLAGRAIDEGQTLVVDDVRTTPGTALPALLTGETTGSEIAAPITSGGHALGVVKAFSVTSRRFSPDDAGLLTTLAAAAAVALTNARLYREAQEGIRLRDEFLSAAAHDLRTPLTSVKGLAQLLHRRIARMAIQDADWLVEGLASIDTTATEMAEQIDELLDLTRLQLGQELDLRHAPTDCVQLARRLVGNHEQMSERHRIRVETALPELIGDWDAVRLGRVLDNLVSNAVKYSPAGGEIVVSVACQKRAGVPSAVLAVRDHGLGIPAADLPHIFDRFQRATNVQGRIRGTGIGLTSARQIVEQHGGTISVESVEGAGSVFTVCLPLGVG